MCGSYPPVRQLLSDTGDFNKGVCHVAKIAVAESDPDMGLFNVTNKHFCFCPNVVV